MGKGVRLVFTSNLQAMHVIGHDRQRGAQVEYELHIYIFEEVWLVLSCSLRATITLCLRKHERKGAVDKMAITEILSLKRYAS